MTDVQQQGAPAASDAPMPVTDAAASPFTMVAGDPSAMVCEGDVCFVPGTSAVSLPPVE
ncbi:hypothetical protein [Agromyces aureus]|uniref:hypothetical protein n=1 Tax=Agromyces aureus TaxID=453304 RepID=UPI000A58F249|nr:hypothetical protein [Agromyces aureus]